MTAAKSPKPENESSQPSLEESLQRLEAIVERLESGDADLEKSIDLYLEGKKLGEGALKRLEALDRKIQIVASDDDQGMEVEDFQ